jgi:hypothetical protein
MKTASILIKYAFKQEHKDKLLGTGLLGAGALTLSHSALKKNLTGRETFYHGTDPQNVPAIKQEGIRPSAKPGSSTILETINPEAGIKSKDLAFITTNKADARSYAIKQQDINNIIKKQKQFGLDLNPMDIMNVNSVFHEDLSKRNPKNPFNNSGIIKAEMPTWKKEISDLLLQNPETEKGFVPGLGTKKEFDTLNQAKGIKGGLSPEFIKGSPKYKGLGLSELGQYIKAKPGSFTKGLGLGALGLGGVGFGAKKLYDHYSKEASLAVPSLENLGLGILAVPSVAHLAGKEMGEDAKSKAEVAGLGVLAAHPTYELAQAGAKKLAPSMLNSASPIAKNVGQAFEAGHLGTGLRQGVAVLTSSLDEFY